MSAPMKPFVHGGTSSPTTNRFIASSISSARAPAAARRFVTIAPNSSRPASAPAAIVTMSAISAASVNALGPAAAMSTGVRCSPSSSRRWATVCFTWSRRSEAVP